MRAGPEIMWLPFSHATPAPSASTGFLSSALLGRGGLLASGGDHPRRSWPQRRESRCRWKPDSMLLHVEHWEGTGRKSREIRRRADPADRRGGPPPVGTAVGIDPSEAMRKQAERRNRRAIREGKVRPFSG